MQAGGLHQEGWAGAAHAAAWPSLDVGVGDLALGDAGREGLIAHGVVPSFGAHQPLGVAPTAGH